MTYEVNDIVYLTHIFFSETFLRKYIENELYQLNLGNLSC